MKKLIVILTLLIISIKAYSQNTDTTSSYISYSDGETYILSSIYSDSVNFINKNNTKYSISNYSLLKHTKPLFAIKTNMLYDLATVLNVELEIPIRQKWSLTAEYIFPWWQREKSNFTMQLLSGQLGLKYWLGNRTDKECLTGWHIGVLGGYGKYDFQPFTVDGTQGRFYTAGISGGFAHSITKALHLEYQLGVGYISSDYKRYDKVRNTKFGNIKVFRYPWETKRGTWIGPIQAKISLVWMLYRNSKKGDKK